MIENIKPGDIALMKTFTDVHGQGKGELSLTYKIGKKGKRFVFLFLGAIEDKEEDQLVEIATKRMGLLGWVKADGDK